MRTSYPTRQLGIVLVVAMIIMAMVALLSLSALRTSDTNAMVAANVQSRQEGLDSAQTAIERVISERDFFQNPAAITAPPYSPLSVDVDGDAREDFSVSMDVPDCLRARPVPVEQIDPAVDRDLACVGSAALTESGDVNAGATMSGSICSNTEWQLTATAQSATMGTQLTVSQGVGVRVRTTDADNWCN
ncbi:MAG TPA: hypothetical protein PLQ67_01695 [Burkholderiaceae bacterium]|nr:hypothetical protein [Burkholderiaceae bacterium]